MDSTKYTVPNLPTPQHILEDLLDPAIIRPNQPLNLPAEEETLRNAYENFVNCKQLEEDLSKHSELSSNLEELNKKLVENIECMKAHAKWLKWLSLNYYLSASTRDMCIGLLFSMV